MIFPGGDKPRLEPSPLELGVTYQNSVMEGSFQIRSAQSILSTTLSKPNGREVVRLIGHTRNSTGLYCRFAITTSEPGEFLVLGQIVTDTGLVDVQVSVEVRAGIAPRGNVLFCSSPYNAFTDFHVLESLRLLLRELRVQVNACDELPSDITKFRVVVLMGHGLRYCLPHQSKCLHEYLTEGGRLVILADHVGRHDAMWANQFTEPYGLVLQPQEYNEAATEPQHISHPQLVGQDVRRLHWVLASPIQCRDVTSVSVHNPQDSTQGFIACSGPHQNLILLGVSLISDLVCVGWPFDNGRLFANLLSGPCASED